ncbi:MAG: ATP-binding cassette domain-containing protein [Thermodesulfobacteriota bacterium]
MAAGEPQVCLTVHRVRKSYGDLTVLQDISFSLQQGEILGIIGPNGAGKTTLFNIISGWLKPAYGKVVFFSGEVTGWPPQRLSRVGLARTFQAPQIFPEMSVLENVLMGAWLGREHRPSLSQAREDAKIWLSLTGLTEKQHARGRDLPLPQQRLVELARALATRPKLLLLDEIAAGFSSSAVKRLAAGLLKLRDQGLTLLLTDHLLTLLLMVADRLLALDRGEIIAQGPPSSLIRHPEVVSAYLGTRGVAELEGDA